MNTFLFLKFAHSEKQDIALKLFLRKTNLKQCLGSVATFIHYGGSVMYFGSNVAKVYCRPWNGGRVNLF